MALTNKQYMVWTDWNTGEFVIADLPPIVLLNDVLFFRDGKQVAIYDKKQFLKYNSTWFTLENAE